MERPKNKDDYIGPFWINQGPEYFFVLLEYDFQMLLCVKTNNKDGNTEHCGRLLKPKHNK